MRVTRSDLAESEGFAPQLVRIIFHSSSAAPGEGFKVDLHWQNVGDEPAEHNYWIFVHFCPEDELDEPYDRRNVFTWDFAPALETNLWRTGFVVKEEGCYFRIPPDVKPGRYLVLVGLFDHAGGGDRVALLNRARDVGGRRFRVGHVDVVAEPGAPSRLLAYRLVWRVREPEERPDLREARCLTHGSLCVALDPDRPLVRGWRLAGRDIPIEGDAALRGPEAEFRDLESGRRHSSLAVGADWTFNSRIASETAAYRCRLKWKGREVATLDIRFRMGHNGLLVRLASVAEHTGFHLLSLTLPSLVSVEARTPGAALAIASWGGMLVDIAESARHREVHRLNWEEPVRGAVLSCGEAAAVVVPVSMDDSVVSEIYETGGKRGALGVQFTTRIGAENAALEFVPRKVSECEIAISAARAPEPASWTTGAAMLAAGYRGKPSSQFCEALCVRIVMRDREGRVRTTLRQAAELLRRISALTLGARQIAYLVGWEDTAGAARVSQEFGGRQDLDDLFAVAGECNARLSLLMQGDSISPASDGFDPSLVSLDGQGDMLREAGSPAPAPCILSPVRYLESGAAERRVARVLEEFPEIKDTVAVTFASAVSSLHDHDPRARHGADESLVARRAAIDLWRKRGLEVCSLGLTQPYVGICPHFLDAARALVAGPFSHQEPIPLVSAVLHGRVTWATSLDPAYGEAALHLFGGSFAGEWTHETPGEEIMDRYYLVALPWSQIARLPFKDYSRQGSLRKVTYGGGASVEADLEARTWRVVCGGYTVCETGLATVPRSRFELAVYSTTARDLTIPLPPGWTASARIRAEAAGKDGNREEVACRVEGHCLRLAVEARRPVLISRR